MTLKIKYKHPIPGHLATKMEFIEWRFNEIKGYDAVIDGLADIVYQAQKRFNENLTFEMSRQAVESVMDKREFQHTLCTAINLDVLCENGMLLGPLQSSVWEDRGTFGVDETLIGVAQMYGTIGVSNAYALDKNKVGIIKEVDEMGANTEFCHTFLDDILCAIAGGAMGRLAHELDEGNEKPTDEALKEEQERIQEMK